MSHDWLVEKLQKQIDNAADAIERLRAEVAIRDEAIEGMLLVAESLPAESDDEAAVRRCTLRRLNEALGRATPRLLMEHSEGQRFYGLRYRELMNANERLRAELAAEIEACASIVEEHIVPVSNRYHGDEYATRAMANDALRDAAGAIRSRSK